MDNEGRSSTAILHALIDGDTPRWAGHITARYPGDAGEGFIPSYAVITDFKMYWERFDGPPRDVNKGSAEQGIVVHSLDFRDVVDAFDDDEDVSFHILTQPFANDYPRAASSVDGAVEDVFQFFEIAVLSALEKALTYSRYALANSYGPYVLATLNRVPVSQWAMCPLCGWKFRERSAHAATCSQNGHYFSDPGHRPIVSFEPDQYGHLVGDEPMTEDYRMEYGDDAPRNDVTLVFLVEQSRAGERLAFYPVASQAIANVRGRLSSE